MPIKKAMMQARATSSISLNSAHKAPK